MNNPSVRVTAIYGPQVTGLGMPMEMTITGFPEPGSKLRKLASSGHPATGDGATAAIYSMTVIGARTSVGMAASIMDSAISATVMKAAAGIATTFTTTAP